MAQLKFGKLFGRLADNRQGDLHMLKSIKFLITATMFSIFAMSALAQSGENPDAAEILTDLRENSLSAEDVRAIWKKPDLVVVSLSDFDQANLGKLRETLDNAEDNFAEIRTAVEANAAIEREVSSQNIAISEIVAVTKADEGNELTLYIEMPELE